MVVSVNPLTVVICAQQFASLSILVAASWVAASEPVLRTIPHRGHSSCPVLRLPMLGYLSPGMVVTNAVTNGTLRHRDIQWKRWIKEHLHPRLHIFRATYLQGEYNPVLNRYTLPGLQSYQDSAAAYWLSFCFQTPSLTPLLLPDTIPESFLIQM